jgi:hypothetical protein
MAINKIRQLDMIELLPNYKFRIRLSFYYSDSITKEEDSAREPKLVTLDPANPSHQPAIAALKQAWDSTFAAANADR